MRTKILAIVSAATMLAALPVASSLANGTSAAAPIPAPFPGAKVAGTLLRSGPGTTVNSNGIAVDCNSGGTVYVYGANGAWHDVPVTCE